MSSCTYFNINYQLESLRLSGLTNTEQSNNCPVLCLHGWLDNAASFLPLFPYMKDKPMVAIDLAGHGLSSHRDKGAHYHFIDYVYDLLALFEHNHWQNVAVVGHSMGGMIATAFAAAFPEKVSTLTLIDSIGFVTEPVQNTTTNLRSGILSRFKNLSKQKSVHHSLQSAIEARENVSDLNYKQAKLLVERGILLTEKGYRWRSDSRLRTKSPLKLSTEQAKQLIQDIKIPVQLICGDKGLSMVKEGIKCYQSNFQKLDIYSLTGGHHVHMEQPEKVASLIKKFI